MVASCGDGLAVSDLLTAFAVGIAGVAISTASFFNRTLNSGVLLGVVSLVDCQGFGSLSTTLALLGYGTGCHTSCIGTGNLGSVVVVAGCGDGLAVSDLSATFAVGIAGVTSSTASCVLSILGVVYTGVLSRLGIICVVSSINGGYGQISTNGVLGACAVVSSAPACKGVRGTAVCSLGGLGMIVGSLELRNRVILYIFSKDLSGAIHPLDLHSIRSTNMITGAPNIAVRAIQEYCLRRYALSFHKGGAIDTAVLQLSRSDSNIINIGATC